MISDELARVLKKQGYVIAGRHSVVHPCRWCKKDLIDEGECYKAKFYGIDSYLCCQMSPATNCQNKCMHCWRAIEFSDSKSIDKKEADDPKTIIQESIKAQQKLLSGFRGNEKINLKKFRLAQEPMHFAISLTGEPTLYPFLGELIEELRKRGKTSFVVTNGLQPEVLKELAKKRQLPTQLYISMNCPDEKMYKKWHRSSVKDAWERFNSSLRVMKSLKGKTRTVIRMTLVKELNMKEEHVRDYVKMIKAASPDFVEVKGYMSVGFARKRLGYETMPRHEAVRDYTERIAISLNELGEDYKILGEHEPSAVVLIGKDKRRMKIKKEER